MFYTLPSSWGLEGSNEKHTASRCYGNRIFKRKREDKIKLHREREKAQMREADKNRHSQMRSVGYRPAFEAKLRIEPVHPQMHLKGER